MIPLSQNGGIFYALKTRAIYPFTTQNLLRSKQRKGNLKKLPYTMYSMKLGKIEKFDLFSLDVFERFCCTAPRIFYEGDNEIGFINHPFVSFQNTKPPRNVFKRRIDYTVVVQLRGFKFAIIIIKVRRNE